MALGSNQQTTTTGAVFIPEIWTQKTRDARESALVLANLVYRLDDDVADAGDIYHEPDISNLTANAKVANTQVVLNAPTENEFTLTINRHYECSYLVEDRLSKASRYKVLEKYSPKAGYAIARTIDSDLAGLYSSLSQTVGNSTTGITDENIRLGLQYLDDADAPQMDRYFAIKPSGLNNLRGANSNKFVSWSTLGVSPSPILAGGLATASGSTVKQIGKNGFAGVTYNLEVYMSTNLVEESGTSDTVHNLLFQKEAFALGVQMQQRMQFQYKQEYLGTLATADSIWGFGVHRSDHAVDFRSDDNV